ncbi:unnamed protein product [Arctogadus glacialis]
MEEGPSCGTIEYMAPEVLGGGPYTHAADWWPLGIALWSLVTAGREPEVLLQNLVRPPAAQEIPVEAVLKLRNHPGREAKATRGLWSPQDHYREL